MSEVDHHREPDSSEVSHAEVGLPVRTNDDEIHEFVGVSEFSLPLNCLSMGVNM